MEPDRRSSDEILVDLISEATERICGFKPEPESVEQFLSQHVHALDDVLDGSPLPVLSRETNAPSSKQTRRKRQDSPFDHAGSAEPRRLSDRMLRVKEAWLEVSYNDGRKEVRRWDASHMRPSSNVINNLRSRPEFRAGSWQNRGIASLRVSVERPRSQGA